MPALLASVTAELERLEDVFNLRRPTSVLSRLNRDRRIEEPPDELLHALRLSDRLHRLSDGAFDPTVQTLALSGARDAPTARAAVGWNGIRFGAPRVVLDRPGAAVTLNGLVRGIAADRIVDLLGGRNVETASIDIGGCHDSFLVRGHRPWSAEIDGSIRLLSKHAMPPTDATDGLWDPASLESVKAPSVLSVTAQGFALADGLATTLALMAPEDRPALLAEFPSAGILRFA